ncbi:TIGR03086 family metal-binding protein [Saccharothrix longispora]|uniref:TIGR03086 family metal-binding protein n=1 Tax=Saccharothrix longispora TaxID=33920 RepID=UPI0028FD8F06|nr:TIGR03086 family metal-binding protein [Saccharothrix longispora]MDU0289484.1 TIGR03086 family metal-binding protein [Saccharothrix longispora]
MSREQLISRAVATTVEVVDGIKPDQLGAPTPCTEFDVRALVNHLMHWAPVLEGAGRKEQVAPPVESDDVTTDDWAAELTARLRATAAAWSTPESWEGATYMGGPDTMPAEVVGGMTLGELVVHTWDLAQATGRTPTWDDEVLEQVHRCLLPTAGMGRDMGIYGPEVPVPDDAPLLHRILGLTGRKP